MISKALKVPAITAGTSFLSKLVFVEEETCNSREVAMAVKKRALREEPFLNTVARKLGNAAGKVARASKDLAENLSALPEKVTAKVEEVAGSEMAAKRRSAGPRQRKKRSRSSGVRVASQTAAKKKRKTVRRSVAVRGRQSGTSKPGGSKK
jgi:hypothetical protein